MPKKKEINREETIVKDITDMAEDSVSLTSKWESNQVKWHKMRNRIKKEKTFPFVGCANIRMPTIETKLRKLKSALINNIFGIRPVVQAIPTPSGNWQTALKIEKFIDHLIMDIIKIKSKAIITVDQTLEKGFYGMKPFWRIEIITRSEEMKLEDLSVQEAMWFFDVNRTPEELEQAISKKFDVDMNDLVAKENKAELKKVLEAISSGKQDITVEFQDVLYNFPEVALCEPERIYVPTDSGYDPQSCSWIIHEFFLPIGTVKDNAKYKGWSIGDITEIENTKSNDTDALAGRDKDIDTEKDLREGISQLERTGKVMIWEYYGWYDINNDGQKEKCVITLAPDFDKVLRKISLPFYSGKFPFVKFFYELTDDRWFSHRGLPEIMEDMVKEIDMQKCQRLDQQTLRNAVMYVHRAGMISPNTIQFIWGQSLPVHGMQPLSDIIAPLNNNNSNVEFSYKDEQMMLESRIEELIGQPDFTLQSMINRRQPRTLGEVQLQQQSMQTIFSLDADMMKSSFEELFSWIWELWCQYGDDEYEFAYFGKEGYEPIKLTKEETQGKYKITVRGNDQNTNPQVRLQKAQMIMMGMQNKVAIEMGVITPMNLANAYKRFYQELDIPNWEELVNTKIQPPQPPPPGADLKIGTKDLTDGEIAQVLNNRGIRPDIQGRALKSGAKVQEKQAEQESQKIDDYSKLINAAQKGRESAETQENT